MYMSATTACNQNNLLPYISTYNYNHDRWSLAELGAHCTPKKVHPT